MAITELLGAGELLPVRKLAAERLGRTPSPATLWRWHTQGTSNFGRLPAVKAMCSVCTTREVFSRWLAGEFRAVDVAAADAVPDASDSALKAAGLL